MCVLWLGGRIYVWYICRPDRTEVLTEELLEAERRIDLIRSTAEALLKKVSSTFQGHSSYKESSGSGSGGGGADPRLDKRIVRFLIIG